MYINPEPWYNIVVQPAKDQKLGLFFTFRSSPDFFFSTSQGKNKMDNWWKSNLVEHNSILLLY